MAPFIQAPFVGLSVMSYRLRVRVTREIEKGGGVMSTDHTHRHRHNHHTPYQSH